MFTIVINWAVLASLTSAQTISCPCRRDIVTNLQRITYANVPGSHQANAFTSTHNPNFCETVGLTGMVDILGKAGYIPGVNCSALPSLEQVKFLTNGYPIALLARGVRQDAYLILFIARHAAFEFKSINKVTLVLGYECPLLKVLLGP